MPSPRTARALARAQVTLALRRASGGTVSQIVAHADIGDEVTVFPALSLSHVVEGAMAEGVSLEEPGQVYAAARLMSEDRGTKIRIDKTLPAGPSLGGGAPLAAATLRALSRLWEVPVPGSMSVLGPEVVAALSSKTALLQDGTVTQIAAPPLPAVLVDPGLTPPSHAILTVLDRDLRPADPLRVPGWRSVQAAAADLAALRNDLESPARALMPELDEVLDELALAPGCLLARLSGMGATCVALFPDRATAEGAAAMLSQLHPVWWVKAVTLS